MSTNRKYGFAAAAVFSMAISALGYVPAAHAAPTSEGQGYVNKAHDLEKSNDFAGAIIQLKNAVRVDPELSTARFELGLLYLRTGDAGSAQRELENARTHGFDETKLMAPLMQAYIAQGRFQDILRNFDPDKFTGQAQSELLAMQSRAQVALQNNGAAHKLIDRALAQSPTLPSVLAAAASLARVEKRFADSEKYVDQGLTKEPENPELLVLKGESRQQARDLDGAIKALDFAVEKQPRYLRARIARAMVNLSRGKSDLVDADVREVLTADPKNPLGLYLRAVTLSTGGNYRDATQILLGLPGLLDSYPPARYLLAATYFGDNQFQSAMGNVELYLKKVPNDPIGSNLLAAVALRLNDPKRAVEVLEPLIQVNPDNNQMRLQLAGAYLSVGRSDEALKLFEQGVKADPQNDQARMALIVSQLQSGSVDAGIAQLQTLINSKPDSLRANHLLVLTHLQAGHKDKAVEAADAMIKANPKNPEAYNLRGTVALAINDLDGARTAFKTALDKDYKFTPAMLNLARMEQMNKKNDAAKEWYRKAIAADPKNQVAFQGLASMAMAENDVESTIKVIEEAVASNRLDAAPRLRLIDLFMDTKQPGRALIAARDLADTLPDDPRSVDALGRTQMANGEVRNGLSSYRRLVTLLPENAEAKRRLARALVASVETPTKPGEQLPAGDRLMEEARSVLDEAITSAPESASVLADRLSLEKKLSGDAAAMKLSEKLVSERPASVPRLVVAGDLAVTLGNNQAALAHFRSAWDKAKSSELLRRLYDALVKDKKSAEGLQLLKAWTAKNPTDYDTRFVLASIAITEGRMDDAIAETEAMKGKLPDNPLLLNNLAWLYGQKNNPRAFEIGQKALELAPNSPDILDTVGWLEVEKRDLNKGLTLLEKSYKLAKENPAIGYHYAFALKRHGDQAKAKDVLRETLKGKMAFKDRPVAEALLKELGG